MGVVVKRLCAGSILSRRITFHIQAELLSVAHPYERAEAEIIARRVGHTFARSRFETNCMQARFEHGNRSRHYAAT